MSKETLVKMAKEKSNLGTAAKVGAGAAALGAGGYLGNKGLSHEFFGGLERDVGSKIKNIKIYESGKSRVLKGRMKMLAGGALAAGGVFGGTNALVQRLKKD